MLQMMNGPSMSGSDEILSSKLPNFYIEINLPLIPSRSMSRSSYRPISSSGSSGASGMG